MRPRRIAAVALIVAALGLTAEIVLSGAPPGWTPTPTEEASAAANAFLAAWCGGDTTIPSLPPGSLVSVYPTSMAGRRPVPTVVRLADGDPAALASVECVPGRTKLDLPAGGTMPLWAARWINPGIDGLLFRTAGGGEVAMPPSRGVELSVRRGPSILRRGSEELRDGGHELVGGIRRFRTWAWVWDGAQARRTVRTAIPTELDAEDIRQRALAAGAYLRRHQSPNGRFEYRYNADTDSPGDGYNWLRHAGTTFSLLQLYQRFGRASDLETAQRAANYLRRRLTPVAEREGALFVRSGRRGKLGGAGLALIAFSLGEAVAPGFATLDELRGLGRYIAYAQEPDGEFRSYYYPPGVEPTDGGRKSIYYSGEVLLGLALLYRVDPDPEWKATAEAGLRFLVEDRWRAMGIEFNVPPDSWLVQAIAAWVPHLEPQLAAQLTDYARTVGDRILAGRLRTAPPGSIDLIGSDAPGTLPNVCTAGSFGEGLASIERLTGDPDIAWAQRAGVQYALGYQFVGPTRYWLSNPERADGGFPMRADDAEVMIDCVQHIMSGALYTWDALTGSGVGL